MVSISPALRNLFNRIFKEETTSTNVKNNTSYEDVGIFNAYLAEQNNIKTGQSGEKEHNETWLKKIIEAIESPKSGTEGEIETDKTVDIHITKNVNGKDVDFTYNIAKIENYAIENSYQSHFKDIPAIREKAPEDRTEAETKLLEEFDNMIKYIVDTGVEYGVDPDSIAAIIRKEVGFDGMSDRAISSAGKGYMQLTDRKSVV